MSAATATALPRRPVPHALIIAIAGAWILAVAVEMTGDAAWLHHDRLLEHGPPLWQGLALWLLAWQAMTVAMMLPSSLPLVRLFAHASAGQPQPRRAMVAFLGDMPRCGRASPCSRCSVTWPFIVSSSRTVGCTRTSG